MIRTLSSYNENPYQVLLPKTVLQSGSDGNRNPTPIKRCEPWYKKRTPQSRMENSIDKSRMNATEKSDKFKLVLKEQKTIYSQFLNYHTSSKGTIYTTNATKISLKKIFLN